MLKMRCVTDAFLETWPKLKEQLFHRTFLDVPKAKASTVLTQRRSLTL